MEGNNLGSVIDLVQRRTRHYLKKDNIGKIVVSFNNDITVIDFYLGSTVCDAKLASLGAKYNHIFNDLVDDYTIHLLPVGTNYRIRGSRYTIWRKGAGFVGNPRLWNSQKFFR